MNPPFTDHLIDERNRSTTSLRCAKPTTTTGAGAARRRRPPARAPRRGAIGAAYLLQHRQARGITLASRRLARLNGEHPMPNHPAPLASNDLGTQDPMVPDSTECAPSNMANAAPPDPLRIPRP